MRPIRRSELYCYLKFQMKNILLHLAPNLNNFEWSGWIYIVANVLNPLLLCLLHRKCSKCYILLTRISCSYSTLTRFVNFTGYASCVNCVELLCAFLPLRTMGTTWTKVELFLSLVEQFVCEPRLTGWKG